MSELHPKPAVTFWYRWRFTVLLLALLCQLLVRPLIGEGSELAILADIPLVAVFLAAIFALFQRPKSRVMGLILGVPSIVGVMASSFGAPVPSPLAGVVFHLIPVVFLVYTVLAILKSIFRERDVSADCINGAFCGYVLLGLAFGHVYCLVELANPDSFVIQDHLGPLPIKPHDRQAMLTYFSLVTMTTLGYGDILPHSPAARTWATIEVMIGQFYVAAIVAELIGLKVSSALYDDRRQRSPLEFGADRPIHGDVAARVANSRPESHSE